MRVGQLCAQYRYTRPDKYCLFPSKDSGDLKGVSEVNRTRSVKIEREGEASSIFMYPNAIFNLKERQRLKSQSNSNTSDNSNNFDGFGDLVKENDSHGTALPTYAIIFPGTSCIRYSHSTISAREA